jgi:hypothetical protein
MKRFHTGVSLAGCFAAMIWGTVAHAQVFVIGVGTFSCGQFIGSIGKRSPGKVARMPTAEGDFLSENAAYQQWLLGFVSGFNATHVNEHAEQVRGIDLAGVDLWMRNWCNQHPTNTVFDGAVAFINEMQINAGANIRGK